ncbi:unnamed protein product [Allacma fusca]|uniref:Uncharacterized protein n=1 Tax=Allacma fusca TaxID=39272 RepID=A0A8J2JQY4_9HEXA|nr:unnamed protein product [Allacma fusca]
MAKVIILIAVAQLSYGFLSVERRFEIFSFQHFMLVEQKLNEVTGTVGAYYKAAVPFPVVQTILTKQPESLTLKFCQRAYPAVRLEYASNEGAYPTHLEFSTCLCDWEEIGVMYRPTYSPGTPETTERIAHDDYNEQDEETTEDPFNAEILAGEPANLRNQPRQPSQTSSPQSETTGYKTTQRALRLKTTRSPQVPEKQKHSSRSRPVTHSPRRGNKVGGFRIGGLFGLRG